MLSKIDLLEPGEREAAVAAAGAALGCSSASGEGIADLRRTLFAALPAEAPAEEAVEPELADYLVYRPAPPTRRDFRILRDAGTLRVAGRGSSGRRRPRSRRRNDVAALTAALERLGVESALRAAGARPGDEILLGTHRFTFQPRGDPSTSGLDANGRTRLGVFGGQFDPPHLGHLAVVRAARDQLALDRLLVMPTTTHRTGRLRRRRRRPLSDGAAGVCRRARRRGQPNRARPRGTELHGGHATCAGAAGELC